MGVFRRMRGLSRSWALEGVELTCPACGRTGTDGHEHVGPDSDVVDIETVAAFGIRGQDRGKPVRECLTCHNWWLVGPGGRLIAIPLARQEAMKAHFAEQEALFDQRMAALRQQGVDQDASPS